MADVYKRQGQKWDAFVLDLSFILWHMLGGITCGLAEIFYVAPYVNPVSYTHLTAKRIFMPESKKSVDGNSATVYRIWSWNAMIADM